jgi:hypothetical protein
MPRYKEIPKLTEKDIKRFFDRVKYNPNNGCYEWMGATNAENYGVVNIRGYSQFLTHRVIFTILKNPVPLDRQVNHLCSNHMCVCVGHLEFCDDSRNRRYCRDHESGYGTQKLTREQAGEIKKMMFSGGDSTELAKMYKVTKESVLNIARGDTWSDVLPEITIPFPGRLSQRKFGSIRLRNSGKYETRLRGKNVGYFDSIEEAEQVLSDIRNSEGS